LPVIGRAADRAYSRTTREAGPRIAGLNATETICPYCAVGCGQIAYTRDGERVIDARERGWQDSDEQGRTLNRTMGFAHLGGATLDNEENYLIKKSFTAMGAVQIENQARI